MKRIAVASASLIVVSLLVSAVAARSAQPRQLTFEERVRAQEAIERVYYSHQIGATKPFEEAVPRELLENKVRDYLRQSAALQEYWKSPITSESLKQESERIRIRTRFPDRLEEIYGALGHDALVIGETFVRASLAERLSRNFFSLDQQIHQAAREEAENLREELAFGTRSLLDDESHRTVADLAPETPSSEPGFPDPHLSLRLELDSGDYDRLRTQFPQVPGEVGPVIEESDAFLVHGLIAQDETTVRVATYTFNKTSWEDWWAERGSEWDSPLEPLAIPAGLATSLSEIFPQATSATCDPTMYWDNGSLDDVPEGRLGHAMVWTGSLMIVWGGAHDLPYLNDGAVYDPVIDTWRRISQDHAPTPRSGAAALWTGQEMIVWGGNHGGYPADGTGARYDPGLDRWTSMSNIGAPTPRTGHTAVWTGQEMVIWGGDDGHFNNSSSNTGARYNPATNLWIPITTTGAPAARYSHVAVWTGQEMIIWGGTGSVTLSSGGRYDPLTDSWRPVATAGAPSRRRAATAVWTGKEMIIWGGHDPALNTGGRYNPATDSWSPTSTVNAPAARGYHSAVWTGSQMIVWGGFGASFTPFREVNTGGRYDPATDGWLPTSTTNAPAARAITEAVWTGSLLIVWGGYSDPGLLNSGGRYDPQTNTWTPTSNPAPAPRYLHSSVWTGHDLIVWGGYGLTRPLGTGARYDPLLDNWTALPQSGAPLARYSHEAVWTGDEMFVYGGWTAFGSGWSGALYSPLSDSWRAISTVSAPYPGKPGAAFWTGSSVLVWGGEGSFGEGGSYDPINDTWKPTSYSTVPVSQYGSSAIWTGREMLVWGDDDLSSPSNGARYNPVTDMWTAMSLVNAPPGRGFPSAVWTGVEMIVWGGYRGYPYNAPVASGGRYNPTTDSWTPVTTQDAPQARYSHSALWTGTRMLIWGGSFGCCITASGALYDPASDAWIPTPLNDAAAARYRHTAVWTGASMIVWGGRDSQYRNSGGQLFLQESPDQDGDGYKVCDGDCQDGDSTIHPDAQESCNGLDDDCDGATDEELGSTTCGVGACLQTVDNCLEGVPRTCVPGIPTAEACDGLDNDCDGVTDEGLGPGTMEVGLDTVRLWPPNHRMVDVRSAVTLSGGCPSACSTAPVVVLTSATSSEPDDATGVGDGQTVDDIQEATLGSPDFDLKVRAERDGTRDGRIYELVYAATDCFGETVVGSGGILVPHDEGDQAEPVVLEVMPLQGASTGSYALQWSPVAGADTYNVLRGRLSRIRPVGSFTVIEDSLCLASGLTGTSLSGDMFDENPSPGEALFYLTEYVKGSPSGYGTESSGRELIIGSGGSCH